MTRKLLDGKEVEELETIVDYERAVKARYKNRINMISVNIQKNFKIIYEKNNILEDCPVCLDPIATDNIIIPVCFHNICSVCYAKCKKCPILGTIWDMIESVLYYKLYSILY